MFIIITIDFLSLDIIDEYTKKPSLADYTRKKNVFVFDHKLRTSLGCRSTRNDMKFSGMDMESP